MEDKKNKTALAKARVTDKKLKELKEYCIENGTTVSKVISDCIDKILINK